MSSYFNNNNFSVSNVVTTLGLATAGLSGVGMLYYNRKLKKLSKCNTISHQSTELSTPEDHQKLNNYLWRYNLLKNSGIISTASLITLGLAKGAIIVYNRRN